MFQGRGEPPPPPPWVGSAVVTSEVCLATANASDRPCPRHSRRAFDARLELRAPAGGRSKRMIRARAGLSRARSIPTHILSMQKKPGFKSCAGLQAGAGFELRGGRMDCPASASAGWEQPPTPPCAKDTRVSNRASMQGSAPAMACKQPQDSRSRCCWLPGGCLAVAGLLLAENGPLLG